MGYTSLWAPNGEVEFGFEKSHMDEHIDDSPRSIWRDHKASGDGVRVS
jgi:hypothetical protein